MTAPDQVAAFQAAESLLGSRFKLERLVVANRERVLFLGVDQILKRRVSLRLNFYSDEPTRAWFLREAEALGQLDHPAIRHVYDVGITGTLAYRVGNWIDGEGLHEAMQRGPRSIPGVHAFARDLLSAMEHAHARGVIIRRVVPASLIVSPAGRVTITDARFSSWTLPAIPAGIVPSQQAFMAPEVRGGAAGDPISDVYTAGTVLYYAITGQEPPLDTREIRPPTELRPIARGRWNGSSCARSSRRLTTATRPRRKCWKTSPPRPAPSRCRRPRRRQGCPL